jgi:CubicO group peptidase (beta-lactamase class C family)
MTWGILLIAVFGLHDVAAVADELPRIEASIRERAEALVGKAAVLGMVVGVVQDDTSIVVAVGQRAVGGPPPDENTLFEIGSVSKTFTGLLLADAVVRGEVQLDQPLKDVLGPAVAVPKYEQHAIRLLDLATHSSGLPRLPTNLPIINPFNPYARYRTEDLHAFLAEHKLARPPGQEYEYSNVGMGLLGHAVAKRAGKSYEQLLNERVCQPLSMKDTVITLSVDQQARLAKGISMFGLPAMNWDLPTLAGAGGIRSTLHDMLIFVRANLAPDQTPLAKAIRLAHEPRFTLKKPDEKSPNKIEIGLAWHITTENGHTVVWHNGMTGGYASYAAVVPAKQLGLVVLCNTASMEVDKSARELLKELLERE